MTSESTPFTIEKQKPNATLWKEVKALAKGSLNKKSQAVNLILENYPVLPQGADDLLERFTLPSASLTLKRRIAISLSKNPRIPWSLYSKLTSNLFKAEDDRINSTLKSEFERYSQLQKAIDRSLQSIQSLFDQQRNTLNYGNWSKILNNISKQYYAIDLPGDYFRHAYFSNSYFSNLLKDIDKTKDSFSSIAASIQNLMTSSPLRQSYLDLLANLRVINSDAVGSLSKMAPSYYPPQTHIETKKTENPLVVKLNQIPPGIKHWHEYQNACRDVLDYCLVPPLLEPFEEAFTEEGIHRRDLIYHIPSGEAKFWAYIQTAYKSIAVIVDPKNYSDELPPNQVVIVSKYFGVKKLGNFGLIVSPKGPSEACRKQQIDRWINHDEIILCLSNYDLSLMVSHKENGKNPETILDNLIRQLRQSV